MDEDKKEKLIRITSLMLSVQDDIREGSRDWANITEKIKRYTQLMKEYFPDHSTQENIEELERCCRSVYSDLTGISYMATFTGRRAFWAELDFIKNHKTEK